MKFILMMAACLLFTACGKSSKDKDKDTGPKTYFTTFTDFEIDCQELTATPEQFAELSKIQSFSEAGYKEGLCPAANSAGMSVIGGCAVDQAVSWYYESSIVKDSDGVKAVCSDQDEGAEFREFAR